MKILLFVLPVLILSSCGPMEGNYITHTLNIEKLGDCSNATNAYSMVANTAGERYIFDYCLKDGFDTATATMDRKGDTIVLHLPSPSAGENTALYKLTLDLDAYPKYNHIQLGDRVINIAVSDN